MKLRRIATSIVVALLLFSMFGVMMVFAPAPSPMPTIPVESNVFVTNEAIDVTLDEPIEVTNQIGESLDVAIPDGVEITNFDEMSDVNLDVSGWEHTTKWGTYEYGEDLAPGEDFYLPYPEYFTTAGYRLLTIYFIHNGPTANTNLRMYIFRHVTPGGFATTVEVLDLVGGAFMTSTTIEVSGYAYTGHIYNTDPAITIPAGEIIIEYFMTT